MWLSGLKTRTKVLLSSGAAVVLCFTGASLGSALAATTATVAPATNLYGCVDGNNNRTLDHVYTSQANYLNYLNSIGGTCPSGSFQFTVNTDTNPSPSPSPSPTSTSASPTPTATTPTPTPTVTTPTPTPTPTGSSAVQPSWAPNGNLPLVFSDEFNGTSVDTSKWQTGWFGTGITGPINTSAQGCYDSNQVTESGGSLHLNAIVKANTCRGTSHPYTTGMVSSNPSALGAGKGFQFARGKVEWRAYIPPGSGACDDWSSLWTDGQSWPTDGEIDTMECLGGTVAAHLHSSASGGAGNGPGIDAPGNFTGWHTFGFDWTASNVTFYYDGASIGTLPYTVASPNYLIMALEIPSGSVTVPEHQDIDWVRVWS